MKPDKSVQGDLTEKVFVDFCDPHDEKRQSLNLLMFFLMSLTTANNSNNVLSEKGSFQFRGTENETLKCTAYFQDNQFQKNKICIITKKYIPYNQKYNPCNQYFLKSIIRIPGKLYELYGPSIIRIIKV